MPRPLSAVVAYNRVLDELKAAENRAVDSGKPTMHAYYADMVDSLERAYGRAEIWPEDGGNPNPPVLRAMRRVLADFYAEQAVTNGYCYAHNRVIRAESAALQVYATRVLRLAGERVAIRSRDWLRAQKRWPDTAE